MDEFGSWEGHKRGSDKCRDSCFLEGRVRKLAEKIRHKEIRYGYNQTHGNGSV